MKKEGPEHPTVAKVCLSAPRGRGMLLPARLRRARQQRLNRTEAQDRHLPKVPSHPSRSQLHHHAGGSSPDGHLIPPLPSPSPSPPSAAEIIPSIHLGLSFSIPSRLPPLVSRLPSPVSRLPSPVFRLPSPASATYLAFHSHPTSACPWAPSAIRPIPSAVFSPSSCPPKFDFSRHLRWLMISPALPPSFAAHHYEIHPFIAATTSRASFGSGGCVPPGQ